MGADHSSLVDEHIDLVRRVAGRIHRDVGAYVELDDLIALGMTGLLEAAERFDIERGVPFAAFAHYRVRGAIYDGLRTMGNLPRRLYRLAMCERHTDDYMEQRARLGARARQPGAAAHAPQTFERARALYDAMRSAQAIYITTLAADESHGAALADPNVIPSDERLQAERRKERLKAAIEALPERERLLIRRSYFEGQKMGQVGRDLGLSPSWTSRLHARAVERLRDMLAEDDP